MRLGLPLLGALGACVAWTALAAADEEPMAKCAVRIIHALHEGEGIDPKITLLRPYLQKPPFTAWKQFKLLDDKELTLAPHGTATFELPNGKQASLTYVDHFIAHDGDHRLRLQFGISDKQKKLLHTTFVLDEGGVLLQAGQKYESGLLVLGISCQTQK
jgi:hypothetical protein